MTTARTKVMCVDDNVLLTGALHGTLETAGFEWAGSLPTADTLVSEAARRTPDVILLDIDMPGRNSFEALDELQTVCPASRVIVYSGQFRSDLVDRSMETGAWGCMSKTTDIKQIIDAIRRVARGEVVLDPNISYLPPESRGDTGTSQPDSAAGRHAGDTPARPRHNEGSPSKATENEPRR